MKDKINFAWPVTAISKEDYDVILDCIKNYNKLFNEKKIMIFGAGIRGAIFSAILESEGFNNIIFTDNNQEKWGGFIDNFPIISVGDALKNYKETIILISTEEGYSIKEQLEKAGLTEGNDFFFLQTNLYEKYISEFKRNAENEILFMGDCMFEVISFSDTNKDSLSEIFSKKLGYEKIKSLTMHGMGIRAFYHVLKAQVSFGMKPDLLVVMINFETLTGKQHLLPRSQHTKLIRHVYDTVKELDDGELAEYVKITENRFKNIQAEFFTTDKYSSVTATNKTGEISSKASKLFFKLHYMYKLNPETENVQYLRRIFEYAKSKNIKVIPFVPPVNYELGEEFFGKTFDDAYNYNLEIVKDLTMTHNNTLLDLSHICTKDFFADISTPDETTNYEGRLKIADRIIGEIEMGAT